MFCLMQILKVQQKERKLGFIYLPMIVLLQARALSNNLTHLYLQSLQNNAFLSFYLYFCFQIKKTKSILHSAVFKVGRAVDYLCRRNHPFLQLMKTIIFLLICVLLTLPSTQQVPLQILSVSDSPTIVTKTVSSSLKGGRYVYMKVMGHNLVPTQNLVFVNGQPCKIPSDGVTDTFITCVTPDSGSLTSLSAKSITLLSGSAMFTTPNVVNYKIDYTPQLVDVFPSASFGSSRISFYGTHKISNLGDGLRSMGDIYKLLLGSQLCNRFDVPQTTISASSRQYIYCGQSSQQQAGKFNVSQLLSLGYALNSQYMRRSSFTAKEYFEYSVLPTITSVSPMRGNVGGQYLTIKGTGFSPNPKNNSITVDGNTCDITYASNGQLSCILAPKTAASTLLATNSSNQTNGFLGGAGVQYARYSKNYFSSISAFVTAVRSQNKTVLGTPQEIGFRADIREGDYYGESYGQVWKGYFTAPSDGDYTFRGVSDDEFCFFLSDKYGSAELPSSPLIQHDNYQTQYQPFLIDYSSAEATVKMQANKSYYFQAYHINWGGPGFCSISVTAPNTDNTTYFQAHGVSKILLKSKINNQNITYTMDGGNSSGYITLKIKKPKSNGDMVTESANLTFGMSESAFKSALNSFSSFSPYTFTVVRTMIDSTNQTTKNVSAAISIQYLVSIYNLRTPSQQAQNFTIVYSSDYTGSLKIALVQPHSPLITGTFGLSIGGNEVKYSENASIPFDTDAWTLQQAIRALGITGMNNVQVSKIGDCKYFCNYTIQFKQYNAPIPQITLNPVGLSGGATSPTLQHFIRRQYSTNLYFDPIDYRFLSTYSNMSSVRVTTNGVAAVCTTNCSYSFSTFSEITSLSRTNDLLNLALSDPLIQNFNISKIKITVENQPCTIQASSTLSNLTCQLSTNAANKSLLVAGQMTPLVYIQDYGIIRRANAVSTIVVNLVTTSFNKSTGGNNGGYQNTVIGEGFPLSTSAINITICNKTVAVKSSQNYQVIFTVPSCSQTGEQILTVTVGGQVANNLKFTYADASTVAPMISSLDPVTSNPAMKGKITVTGQNFGSDASKIKAFLSNQTVIRMYQLLVLTAAPNKIELGMPGGLAGKYFLQMNHVDLGDFARASNTAVAFSYQSNITNISPTSGSYYGGTLLTITGVNFVNDLTVTQVFIGYTLNYNCKIQSITPTQIKCRTPNISSDYMPGKAVDVAVATRLIVQSVCFGVCKFSYNANDTAASIQNISVANITTGDVTLTGANFLGSDGSANASLTSLDGQRVYSLASTSANATSLTFKVDNNIISDRYQVRVRNDYGESNPMDLTVTWVLGTVSWAQGGSIAGNLVKIGQGAGSGYPASIDGTNFQTWIVAGGKNYTMSVASCCRNNEIQFYVPAFLQDTSMTFNFKGPVNTIQKNYSASSSLTPLAYISSGKNLVADGTSATIGFTMNSSVAATIVSVDLVSNISSSVIFNIDPLTITTTGSGVGAVSTFGTNLPAGAYKIVALTTPNGIIAFNDTINVVLPQNLNMTSQAVSYNGGVVSIASGNLSPASYIMINGFKGVIANKNATVTNYTIPPFVTPKSQSEFNLKKTALLPGSQFTYFSDKPDLATIPSYAFDSLVSTTYISPNQLCWVGVDAGVGMQVKLDRIRFFGSLSWTNVAKAILHSVFQGSNDLTNWTQLGKVDQTVHTGWNTLISKSALPYRYIRFSHNATSKCQLAEIELYGILISNVEQSSTDSYPVNVTYVDGLTNKTFPNTVEFRKDKTATVTSVLPRYGDVFGGYDITLTGTNLDAGIPSILIDSIPCAVTKTNSTAIVCTAGPRPTVPTTDNTFTVTIGLSDAILQDRFLYVLRWSDSRTWGVDMPPINDDLVYIPTGLALLVDQDTPILQAIVVEGGTLVFSDEKDMVVQAGFITMNGGSFIAGTQDIPYTKKLTFIMYGGYYGIQQPMFGNKGIGCMNCKFSMYGTPRIKTWTTLAATINPADLTLTLNDDVDWVVGQQIVVASTSFLHTEAEQKTIASITGKTITVDSPFLYKHVSVIDNYGSDKLVMQAQVGLLTRNIKMMGDPSSAMSKYGSHLMLTGQTNKGFEAQVAYSEFTQCGQPQILGRYCIHFHMAGDVPTSFARGNAVHYSFARVITIHGVHYLTVEENVGYRVSGHNFFVQDGIQTHNVIRNNLAIGSLAATNMLQTDTSVASFWITNPTNDFYGNRAAGGDFYGIWYEIKMNPDGPSATMDVCPMGNPLGYVANNVAHSNIRFGLRIFILAPRLYPCEPIGNFSDAFDPWSYNPSIPAVYSNFTIYKNLQDGVLAEQTGNVIFNNFTVAENYRSGFQFYVANITKEPPVINNSVIIGQSTGNAESSKTNYTLGMSSIITGRTGTYTINNTRFSNFPTGSTVLQTCSFCDDSSQYTNLGTQINVNKLTFNNISGNYLFMIGLKRDVIYDADCSFCSKFDSLTRTNATITYGFNHIASYHADKCPPALVPTQWDNAIICDQSITIRRVWFTNLAPFANFQSQFMMAAELADINQTIARRPATTLYSNISTRIPTTTMQSKDKANAYALPFITGMTYQIWWGTGIDFTHLSIVTTPNFPATDKGIIFKFNNSLNRQLYEIGPMRAKKALTKLDFISESVTFIDSNSCGNGEYYHNDSSVGRMLSICQSGKKRAAYEYTEVNSVICRHMCPAPAGTFVKQNFIRLWSNASQWPNGTVPQAGDNVTINGNWTVKLNVDPVALNYLIVDGDLFADDTRDINITANVIHIRAGSIIAGQASSPFVHKFTIQLNGQKNDKNSYVIDSVLAGSKFMVVTGQLNLFGVAPATVTTYLNSTAIKDSSNISVASSQGWAVGDTLVIAPSFSNAKQYENVTIQSLNDDGTITLKSPLLYTHYGATNLTIDNTYGKLDTRTRVGHVSRNIQIVPGPDADWGYSVIVYGYKDRDNVTRNGSAQLVGVQFLNGGQLDTVNSPLVFYNDKNNVSKSLVSNSSFMNCKAKCIYINTARNITLDRNVLYKAWISGIQALVVSTISITNNLIIGVSSSSTLAEGTVFVACMSMYEYADPATSGILVQNNDCMGSTQHGFAFPFMKCSQLQTNPFAYNTVGSANVGFILQTNGEKCQGFSYAQAFACNIGQICGPPNIDTIILTKFVMADNRRSVTLKIGASEGGTNHTAYLTNSFISAVSRPTCAECYGSGATRCTDSHGMRMFVPSANGETLPGKFGGGFDVICKEPVYDAKSFLINVTFDNFRKTYTGAASACGSNFVFKPHSSAWDESGSVNLYNSSCLNCDNNSYLLAPNPNQNFLGWFGGCGDIVCTGFNNYLIQDFDGGFLGTKGTIMPNNKAIGDNEAGCTYSANMNAYTCPNRLDFGVLEYQSVAADFKTRIMWPVNLTYDGSNFTTQTNGWRDWQWLANQPQNKRFGRFISIIRYNQTYNMTYTAKPPQKLELQLQKRSPLGNSSNYVIIKLQYPMPNQIRVTKNNVRVKPILLTDGDSGARKSLNPTICGDNYYFYTNYTVHFVLTEEPDCVLLVKVIDTIQLTTRFAMNINDFYSNSSIGTNFIDKLCALLQINDTSRVKIVGVRSGSTIIDTQITPAASESSNLSAQSANLQNSINSGQFVNSMSAVGQVTSVSSTLYSVSPTDGDNSGNSSGSGMGIGIIVGIVVGVIILVGVVVAIVVVIRKQQLSAINSTSPDQVGETKNGSASYFNREMNMDAPDIPVEKHLQGFPNIEKDIQMYPKQA